VTTTIFLSYSHRDRPIMREVRDALRRLGWEVWMDENLKPGTPSWKDEVEQAIERAQAVVVILSPDAKRSPWVEREIEYAENCEVPIFPVLARGSERESIPFEITSVQYADVRGGFIEGMRELVSGMCQTLGVRDISYRLDSLAETTLIARRTVEIRRPKQRWRGLIHPVPERTRLSRSRRRQRWQTRIAATALLLTATVSGVMAMGAFTLDGQPADPAATRASDDVTPLAATRTPAPSSGGLLILYDAISLTLINQTGGPVDVSALSFGASDAAPFYASEWSALTLEADECLQVWGRDVTSVPRPSACRSRQAWRQIATGRVFWRAGFSVRQSSDETILCPPLDADSADLTACRVIIAP
jgi:hypothetical protein